MLARLLDRLRDPDNVGGRRILVIVIALIAVGAIAAIAWGRQKGPPRAMQAVDLDPALGTGTCVCPVCGASLGRVPGRDCEELACPRDGAQLQQSLLPAQQGLGAQTLPLAAARAPEQRLFTPAAQTQAPSLPPVASAPAPVLPPAYVVPLPEVERMEPQAIYPPGFAPQFPVTQPGAAPLPWPPQLRTPGWMPQPTMRPAAFVPQRPGGSDTCVCPFCGSRVPNDGHLYCPGLRCPSCGGAMLPGVRVGADVAAPGPPVQAPAAPAMAPGPQANASGRLVAAICGPYGCFEDVRPVYPVGPYLGNPSQPSAAMGNGYASNAYPGNPYLGNPYLGNPYVGNPYLGALPVASVMPATAVPTYTNAVADIVARNCLRCHGGSLRSLATYENLRVYAMSGLLAMMISPGGPMSHFLSPAEAKMMLDWVQAGEPR